MAAVAILLMGFSSSGGSEWLLSIESMLPASEMDSTSPSSSSNGFGGILGAVKKRDGALFTACDKGNSIFRHKLPVKRRREGEEEIIHSL